MLAIVLDRITQAVGEERRERGHVPWYHQGPTGAMLKVFGSEHQRRRRARARDAGEWKRPEVS